jgi:folylpolyglutamate synthase
MIELGLARIARLVNESAFPWKAIHVAGTNGKGSVCAYMSSMLHTSDLSYGRFTSPHLIDRWDCININGSTVQESMFRQVECRVKAKNETENIQATEFELLTATAFEIFALERVKIGLVEVGLGGRTDATNVLKDPLATVITKIGKDHESFLGNTIEAIAYHKAGIMKAGVPCVVDGTNSSTVLRVLNDCANEIAAGPVVPVTSDQPNGYEQFWTSVNEEHYEEHQLANIAVALQAVKIAFRTYGVSESPQLLASAVKKAYWPGRLQLLSIQPLTGRKQTILLDGAHNPQSVRALASYVNRKLRLDSKPVTWVLAVTEGKDLGSMLPELIQAHDKAVFTEFGPVDGMPWVKSAPALVLQDRTLEMLPAWQHSSQCKGSRISSGNLPLALKEASTLSNEDPLVIAGSLYLVSDVLRMLRRSKAS